MYKSDDKNEFLTYEFNPCVAQGLTNIQNTFTSNRLWFLEHTNACPMPGSDPLHPVLSNNKANLKNCTSIGRQEMITSFWADFVHVN